MTMNILEALRLQSIFGGNTPEGSELPEQSGITGGMNFPETRPTFPRSGAIPSYPDASRPSSGVDDYGYTPETRFSDLFEQHMSAMPTRPDPKWYNRIGAIIAGVSRHPERAEDILYGGYNRNMYDWAQKANVLRPAMAEERQRNTQERIYARDREKTSLEERKLTERERANRELESNRRIRTSAYDFRQRNPNHQIRQTSDGFLVGIDPQTNQTKFLVDDDGKKIKGSQLTYTDRLNLQTEGIEDRTSGQIEVENARSENDLKEIRARGEQARQTKTTPPPINPNVSQPSNKPLLPSQKRVDIMNNANRAKAKYPHLARYIKIQGNNVDITPPSQGIFGASGPSPEDHKKLRKEIYGEELPDEPKNKRVGKAGATNTTPNRPTTPTRPTGASRPQSTTRPPTEELKVRVLRPDPDNPGKWISGQIPASRLEEALAKGWRKQ